MCLLQMFKTFVNKEDIQIQNLIKKPNKARWNEIYQESQKVSKMWSRK